MRRLLCGAMRGLAERGLPLFESCEFALLLCAGWLGGATKSVLALEVWRPRMSSVLYIDWARFGLMESSSGAASALSKVLRLGPEGLAG